MKPQTQQRQDTVYSRVTSSPATRSVLRVGWRAGAGAGAANEKCRGVPQCPPGPGLCLLLPPVTTIVLSPTWPVLSIGPSTDTVPNVYCLNIPSPALTNNQFIATTFNRVFNDSERMQK